jgi:MFS family permease
MTEQAVDAAPVQTEAGADSVRAPSGLYANYVLVIFAVTQVLAVIDRQAMSMLLEPIKADLHATDTQMSLLTGAAFVIFYALFGIPIARWADSGDRRRLLAIGVAIWSAATAACGVAQNFLQMALARAAVGMGEASSTPTSMSLIADYFRRDMRPQKIAVFNVLVTVGTLGLMPLLGWVAQNHGWRAAMIALGLPGVAVALIVQFTVREPKRGAMDEGGATSTEKASLLAACKAMWASPAFMLILSGTAIVGLGAGTLGAWGAAIMMRVYHVTPVQYATVAMPLGAVATIIGMVGGGFITTWALRKTKDQRMLILLPALASLITVPGGVLYAWGPSWSWVLFGSVIAGLSMGFRTAPYQALMMDLVPANCRGMAAAASVIATSVVGSAGGPLVVGMISDALAPSVGAVTALRQALIFAPVTLFLGCIPFFLALRYFDKNGEKKRTS